MHCRYILRSQTCQLFKRTGMERQFSLVNSISVYSIDGHFVRSITSCIVSVFSIITVLNRIIYLILLLQYESKFCYNISIYFHNIFVNIFNVFFFIEEVKSRSATSGKKIHFNNLYSFLCLSYKLLNGKLFRYPNFHIHYRYIELSVRQTILVFDITLNR